MLGWAFGNSRAFHGLVCSLCQNYSDSNNFSIALASDLTWEALSIFFKNDFKKIYASWAWSSCSLHNSFISSSEMRY